MFERILIATDGTRLADDLVECAATLTAVGLREALLLVSPVLSPAGQVVASSSPSLRPSDRGAGRAPLVSLAGLAALGLIILATGCRAPEEHSAPPVAAAGAIAAEVPEGAAPNSGERPHRAADGRLGVAKTETAGRLRLVDVGADRCIPCRAMAPILEELRVEHAERLEVIFVDVWKNPEAAEPYGVRIIPTQIFYDADGRELWRHQGFLSKRDILGNWKRLGHDLEAAAAGPENRG